MLKKVIKKKNFKIMRTRFPFENLSFMIENLFIIALENFSQLCGVNNIQQQKNVMSSLK